MDARLPTDLEEEDDELAGLELGDLLGEEASQAAVDTQSIGAASQGQRYAVNHADGDYQLSGIPSPPTAAACRRADAIPSKKVRPDHRRGRF